MRLQHLLCSIAIALVPVPGCKRDEAISRTPASQPAGQALTAAPQIGTAPSDSRTVGGQTVDDAAITAKVKASLLQASDVKGTDVNVDTANGTVTLRGSVQSQAQANRTVEIARTSPGVKGVISRLAVRPKP